MKREIVILFLMAVLTQIDTKAQVNLVPNPSFEDTVTCPINGWIVNSAGWQAYSSTPDYYNACCPSWCGYTVPNNFTGFHVAASGQAYAGAISYVEQETNYSLNREIIGRDLSQQLIPGQQYFVSLQTTRVGNTPDVQSSVGISKVGVLFSTVPFTNIDSSTIPPIQNYAHVYSEVIITDTSNWIRIFGSFVADSAYQYMCLGNFF